MQFYQHRTAIEQSNRLPQNLREAYLKSQLDRITIFDGNKELELTGYAEYSFLDEKSYKTQPVRSNDGSIQNIEDYATFLTPRLIIKYNMMNIDDYRLLMKMFKQQNGYIVKCYDVVEDSIVRNEMYVATPSMPTLYQKNLIALGIQAHSVELIGTNVPVNPDNIEDGTEQISFYIESDAYNANRGQIWKEFISKNNSIGTISDDGYIFSDGYSLKKSGGDDVLASDYIYSDTTYYYR